jgi:hypothetical protein
MIFEENAKNGNHVAFGVDRFQFTMKENAPGIDQLEKQIDANVPHLQRPQHASDKKAYQLYFLFQDGNVAAFLKAYEANNESLFFESYLKAAVVYATLQEISKAQKALELYFETAFRYRPLTPFVIDKLLQVMDKEFSSDVLRRLK